MITQTPTFVAIDTLNNREREINVIFYASTPGEYIPSNLITQLSGMTKHQVTLSVILCLTSIPVEYSDISVFVLAHIGLLVRNATVLLQCTVLQHT